jgi:hypothetical protein
MLITENQLDEWVRGNARDAQGVIVELVSRLIAVSSPRPKERRFPLGDSIGQHGPDVVLNVDFPFYPFVPEGRSFWEIGTNVNAAKKATSDYKSLVEATPEDVRKESAFVFVTPLSGRRDWEYTWEEYKWKEDAQEKWLKERQELNDWREVYIIDGTKLIDWLHQFPSVELWLAKIMNKYIDKIDTLNQHWDLLKTIGEPPLLTPHLFLVNRESACAKLKEMFDGNSMQLKLNTYFSDQVVNFVSAYVASLDKENQLDIIGRSLVISGSDTWNAIVTQQHEKHFLVADFDLDLAEGTGTIMLEKARRAGHAVIFGGIPGGIPHPNCELIPNPNVYQVKDALEKAGYGEERARTLAQKSGGNLSSLLRCLQNLSLMPEWAQETPAAELAIAEILGSWNENLDADRATVEELSGNSYGEWIGKMREVVLRPGVPLTQMDGTWKFVARYEGWYTLGSRIYDEHLDRLLKVAINVLREMDPKFELPQEERYAASVYGKVLSHSNSLRKGLAETLALLGSHPNALTSCSYNKAETTAILAVRETLGNANWVQWASLNDLLPLLAEAAPTEFLDAVDNALSSTPCPFDELFAQESSGTMGTTYMSGLLWALETLAWDEELLIRVVMILGELAVRDPGGNWSNRPANSLTTILLPWLPQTCASIDKRERSISALLGELPDTGWTLLLSLLPQSHRVSSGSRRPSWRMIIPENWSKEVTLSEYWEQSTFYAELAIDFAKSDSTKLIELINRLDDLPLPVFEQLLVHLESESVMAMSINDRLRLWTELLDLVNKHRKFVDAKWAMKQEQVDRIAAIAEKLIPDEPEYRHQRLFSERDFDLYEDRGNYTDQRMKLETRRQIAVEEIATKGGTRSILDFASAVQSPWRVGIAFGVISDTEVDETILPDLLDTEQKSLVQFAGGFVWGRFRSKGWQWAEEIDTSQWSSVQIGQFLTYLPFAPEAWKLSGQLLGEDELLYWTRTNANPYDTDENLEMAIDSLVKYGRPFTAMRCLYKMQNEKQPLNNKRAVGVLLAALESSENSHMMDQYEIVEIIKALQDDPETDHEDLYRVEWAYLPLLEHYNDAYPKLLESRLANEPRFFCEIIRLVFRSKKEERTIEEPKEQAKSIATNAYHLLSEWRTPPGCLQDGSYDGSAFTVWLEEVKKECIETGHFEIAMSMVGQMLIYAPADPDGLWIHRSVAKELNTKDVDAMRRGFSTGLFNSRVHGFSNGKEEQELASKYRSQAEDVDKSGFYRLAATLRELATSYEHEAKRNSSTSPFED